MSTKMIFYGKRRTPAFWQSYVGVTIFLSFVGVPVVLEYYREYRMKNGKIKTNHSEANVTKNIYQMILDETKKLEEKP